MGNHEFDFGPESLAKIIQTADKNDGIPQIVASNLEFSKKSVEDDELQLLFSDDVIQPFSVINKNGLKIGIFGLIGSDAANVAPASKPVKFSNPAKKAKKITRYLKNKENVDIVILLSHSGIGYDKIKNDIDKLIDAAKKLDLVTVRKMLQDIVPEYTPVQHKQKAEVIPHPSTVMHQ